MDLNSLSPFRSRLSGPIWLFFGCRRRDQDWLYREEMEGYLKTGVLSELHTAFSRDDPKRKVYVQDRIVEHGARLCKLLMTVSASWSHMASR